MSINDRIQTNTLKFFVRVFVATTFHGNGKRLDADIILLPKAGRSIKLAFMVVMLVIAFYFLSFDASAKTKNT